MLAIPGAPLESNCVRSCAATAPPAAKTVMPNRDAIFFPGTSIPPFSEHSAIQGIDITPILGEVFLSPRDRARHLERKSSLGRYSIQPFHNQSHRELRVFRI